MSAFRSYRDEEIAALLPVRAGADWAWEFGRVRVLGFWRTPYFFGYRRAPQTCAKGSATEEGDHPKVQHYGEPTAVTRGTPSSGQISGWRCTGDTQVPSAAQQTDSGGAEAARRPGGFVVTPRRSRG